MLVAQVSDLHISRESGFLDGRVAPRQCLERAVAHLNRLVPRPDVVLVSGDLTEHGGADEYALVRESLSALQMPVFAVPGNHDSAAMMRDCLPVQVPAREPGHASFVIEGPQLRLIGLDTSVDGKAYGELCANRLAWLENALTGGGGTPVLIFMHHPPFDTGIEAMDRCGLLHGRDRFGEIVRRNASVSGIVCGHVHRPIQTTVGGVPVHVASSAAHQVALDLREGAALAYCLEPGRVSLHRCVPGMPMVSHSSYIDSFPGPFPF
ncbi:MAG: phosphodiesterase [Betaproteobacteria bacterium HGW-Betaproteobacteria-13]|jgi:3',5'-cyclic AMP phosphodiesterase CpdA|uniref:Phosphodiesterase n=1 Tax=Parazoarcus communis TaxID=41977 RepID=A0A2U8GYF9_9RHOO|nr:phosphodiesterase [Parazoarcus communis]AWI78016.1 phosphodiesterase [Parazoarcus communis]PKO80457.1 MAG: phosphodiesterase [Betaproteobacteria bacterium HGW-Betaproteobacteria-13]